MESDVAQLPVSHKVLAWVSTNKKPALWGTGLLSVAVLVIWFVIWQQGEKEATAGEALSTVTLQQMSGAAGHPEAAAAFLKVADTYPKSIAGARALLLAASSLFEAGKYPEAQAQFEKFRREHRDSPLMGEALLGIAACLDAQGKTNEAAGAYKELIDRHSGEAVIPQAKFALARLYESQNKPELARGLFEEVARNNPSGSLGSEAGMRYEELTARHPELAPAQPIPANAPYKIEKQ